MQGSHSIAVHTSMAYQMVRTCVPRMYTCTDDGGAGYGIAARVEVIRHVSNYSRT